MTKPASAIVPGDVIRPVGLQDWYQVVPHSWAMGSVAYREIRAQSLTDKRVYVIFTVEHDTPIEVRDGTN